MLTRIIKRIKLNKIMKEESKRIMEAERDFEDRSVDYDALLFREASEQLWDLYRGKTEQVTYHFDMWEEAHTSLDRVIEYLKLEQVDLEEGDEGYGFFTVKLIR